MQDLKLVIGNKNTSSWSLRPWLLLKHLRIPFEEVRVALRRPDTGRQIRVWAPSGKVPVLRSGDITVWDTLAIAEFIAEEHPELWPEGRAARAVARSVSAEMHSGFAELRRFLPMDFTARFDPPGRLLRKVAAEVDRVREVWGDCRARFGQGGPFLFGRFSIADAMFAPVCSRFVTYAVPIDETCAEYVEAVMALPAMQEWGHLAAIEVESGVETWVEPTSRVATPPRQPARIEPIAAPREPAFTAPAAPIAAWRQPEMIPGTPSGRGLPPEPVARSTLADEQPRPPRRPPEQPAEAAPIEAAPLAPEAGRPLAVDGAPVREQPTATTAVEEEEAAAPEETAPSQEEAPPPEPARDVAPAADPRPLSHASGETFMAALVRHVGQERRQRMAGAEARGPSFAAESPLGYPRAFAAPPTGFAPPRDAAAEPPGPERDDEAPRDEVAAAPPAAEREWPEATTPPPPEPPPAPIEPRSLPSFRVRRFGLFSSKITEPEDDAQLPPAPLARPGAARPEVPSTPEEDRRFAAAPPAEEPAPPPPAPEPPPAPSPPPPRDQAPARPFNIGMIKPIGDGIRRRR